MPSFRPKMLLPAMMLLSLTNCGTENFEAQATRTVNPCRAVPLVAYTRAQQAQVADEIDAAAPSAMWPRFVRDYGALRAAVRACQGVR